jgi:hypothetical protein
MRKSHQTTAASAPTSEFDYVGSHARLHTRRLILACLERSMARFVVDLRTPIWERPWTQGRHNETQN